jgi:hypothetical protein
MMPKIPLMIPEKVLLMVIQVTEVVIKIVAAVLQADLVVEEQRTLQIPLPEKVF